MRFLFAYDRWAIRELLGVLDDLDPALLARTDVVGERGPGGILGSSKAGTHPKYIHERACSQAFLTQIAKREPSPGAARRPPRDTAARARGTKGRG